jgi:hypothetical protein
MRRVLVVVGCTGLLLGSGISVASAAPAANGHNCAGFVVSQGAGSGFGQVVSAAAREQLVDNFGLADCGQAHRNNP